jgi:hypothetical protein
MSTPKKGNQQKEKINEIKKALAKLRKKEDSKEMGDITSDITETQKNT